MLNISKQALIQLREYRERRGPESCVRIGILSGSTTGPTLGISVDEKKENDELFEFDGVGVIIDRPLLEYCGAIEVEYVMKESAGCSSGGFKIVPKNQI